MAQELEPIDLPRPSEPVPTPEYYDWRHDNWALAGLGALVADLSLVVQETADPAHTRKTVAAALITLASGVVFEAGRRVRKHFLAYETEATEEPREPEPLS